MTKLITLGKWFLPLMVAGILSACTQNPATGEQDFTLFLPESSENSVGAEEHEKIIQQYGVLNDPKLQKYVDGILAKLTPHTEREEVRYTITILDDPMVNAFALPGGYLYVTRGLMALANDESELASVIAHEIGHVTARHAASRISRGAVAGLGAAILANVLNVPGAGQVLGLGGDLYISSYSRSQEHEADALGVRYASRAGYDPFAMSRFLKSLNGQNELERAIAKQQGKQVGPEHSYFSTHPVTSERVTRSASLATGTGFQGRQEHMRQIKGMIYGDSPAQGFVADNRFVHPDLRFAFDVPSGFEVENKPSEVILFKPKIQRFAIIFDMASISPGQAIDDYVRRVWMVDAPETQGSFQNVTVNGMKAATAQYEVSINNRSMDLRVMAIRGAADTAYRFAVAMPKNLSQAERMVAQKITYSFTRLNASQARKYGPKRIQLRVASSGMTVDDLARTFPYDDDLNAMRFRALNGIESGQLLQAGRLYKTIVQ